MAERQSTRYILVTPVKDEVRLIEKTILSVVSQSILPTEWIIVSDGSTDGTDEVVQRHVITHPWITLISLPPRQGRSFAAVVRNTELGVRSSKSKDYAFIGLLDSDVTFEPDYYETLIKEMQADAELGICGGAVIDIGLPKDKFPRNRYDIPGATQFFRRECFEGLGGLIAVPDGGWDSLTCTMARMNGWNTRLFTHKVMDHLKPRNIAHGGLLRRRMQMGERDYALGYHPLFECVKCISRTFDHPMLFGSLAWFWGFTLSYLRRKKRIIPSEVVHFAQAEQMRRLKPWSKGK